MNVKTWTGKTALKGDNLILTVVEVSFIRRQHPLSVRLSMIVLFCFFVNNRRLANDSAALFLEAAKDKGVSMRGPAAD